MDGVAALEEVTGVELLPGGLDIRHYQITHPLFLILPLFFLSFFLEAPLLPKSQA